MRVYTGTGISYFHGSGSVNKSNYYRNGLSFPLAVDSIGNHFGKKIKSNFLVGLQLDLPLSTVWNFLLSTQYESTGSRLESDSVLSPAGNFKTNGTFSNTYDFISVNPQIGRCFSMRKMSITLHGGFDYCFKLNYADNFNFVDQAGINNSIGHTGGRPEVNDFRITAGIMATLKKWSLDLNYKHGLTNYNINNTDKASLRILHLKLIYTILHSKSRAG
ncbi:MAG: hypothetical protein K2X48_10510 [Chitinophagaceae bacterium]|nr:hypothetical protein [Chitinophagaceae bacterium]